MSRAFLRQPQARAGLALSGIALLAALAGSLFAPHGAADFIGAVYGGPAQGAPLGYDYLGRDVLSRLLLGGWSVVWMAFSSAFLALLAGTVLGLVAAYAGGRTDRALSWSADVLLAFPNLILVLLVVALLGRAPWLIVATASLAFVPGVLRLVRSLALGVAEQEFVEAAELLGYPRWHVLLREILPNVLTPLLVHFGSMLSWAVTILSGLSFLGYGVAPPAADWGLMINENRAGLQAQPLAVLAPVLMIVLFALGVNLLAEAMARSNAGTEQR
jgi:peptide/nickel transport system permease protein